MGRKLRKLKKGEHRYITVAEKLRIAKPKNFKKWKEKREVSKKVWQYKKEVLQKEKRRYKEIITKRKKTIKLKRERALLEYTESQTGMPTTRLIQKEMKKFKTMYRLSVGLNYVVKRSYNSYKIQVWARTKEELELMEDEYIEKCVKGLEKHLGFKKAEWWIMDDGYFTGRPNISYQQVPFDCNLINTEQEGAEFSFATGRTRARGIIKKQMENKPLDSPDWL